MRSIGGGGLGVVMEGVRACCVLQVLADILQNRRSPVCSGCGNAVDYSKVDDERISGIRRLLASYAIDAPLVYRSQD